MPVGAIGLGVSALASGAAGVAGALANASAQDRAKFLQQEGVQQWLDINVPDPAQQKLALQNFVQAGKLSPQLTTALQQHDSEFKKMAADPALKNSRLKALSSLENQAYGGEQVQDTAAREKAMIDAGAVNKGHQGAIVSDFQRRGQGGTGLELQARLDAQQADQDRLANNSLDIESQRRQRALQAAQGAGSLAGDIQNQNWQQQSDVAKAQDAINLFNTQNSQNALNKNVDINNQAQQYNLTNAQDIANKNTGVANTQETANKALLQQQFQNQAAKAAGVSGQYGQQAQQAIASGQNAAQMWGNIAGGIGQVGGGITQQLIKDEDDAKKAAQDKNAAGNGK